MIPELEIGSAILSCSTKFYCNPKKQFDKNFQSATSNLKITKSKTIVEETEKGVVHTPAPDTSIRNLDRIRDSNRFLESQKSTFMDDSNDTIEGDVEIPETQDKETQNPKSSAIQAREVEIVEIHSENSVDLISINASVPSPTSDYIVESGNKRKQASDGNREVEPRIRRLDTAQKRKAAEEPTMHRAKQMRTHDISLDSPDTSTCSRPRVTTRKRPHYEDSEDEADELFKFDNSLAKKYKIPEKPDDAGTDVVTDHPIASSRSETVSQIEENSQELFRRVQLSRKQIYPKPMSLQPIKSEASCTGWLTKEFTKLNTDSGSEQVKIDCDLDSTDSFTNSAIIKFVDMEIKPKRTANDLTDSSFTGRNFKKFVKKRNFIEQSKIVPTIQVRD